MAFTSAGVILFSKFTLDFNTVISAMESLFSMLIGKFNFNAIQTEDRYILILMIINITHDFTEHPPSGKQAVYICE